jgi:hypothetical protein
VFRFANAFVPFNPKNFFSLIFSSLHLIK